MDYFSSLKEEILNKFSEEKIKGDAFERWVLEHSAVTTIDKQERHYWTFFEWRSDKCYNNYVPMNNQIPDFVFINFKDKKMIAIECKYRSNLCNLEINLSKFQKFKKYYQSGEIKISEVYIVIGIGSKSKFPNVYPNRLFVISLSDITTNKLLKKYGNSHRLDLANEKLKPYSVRSLKRGEKLFDPKAERSIPQMPFFSK